MNNPNSLGAILATRPPREISGARTANRFDFQKDWVICSLLEFHSRMDEYLVLCDYHDDVVVLDKEMNPQQSIFYQIKTLTGKNWTISKLLTRKKGADGEKLPSILGKLYVNYVIAKDYTPSLHFVSNASFDVPLENGQRSISLGKISCHELTPQEVLKIKQKLSDESGLACEIPSKPDLFLEVTPLSVQDHTTHTKGKLAEFLETFLPGGKHSVSPAYQALLSEVRRKTTHEGPITGFDQLCSRKGIGKSMVDEMLRTFGSTVDLDKAWGEIYIQLESKGIPFLEIQQIRACWKSYEVERMSATNEVLQKLRNQIKTIGVEICSNNPNAHLTEICDLIKSEVGTSHLTQIYSPRFLTAMCLMEVYEQSSIQEVDTQLEEEA